MDGCGIFEIQMSTELSVKDKSGGGAPLKIAPFKSAIRQTEPHRHNGYFELIFLTTGQGVHVIDGRRYFVEPPILFVIRKDQVHFWELTTPGEGFVLIIRKEFVDGLTDGRLRSLFGTIMISTDTHDQLVPEHQKFVKSTIIVTERIAFLAKIKTGALWQNKRS